MDFTLAKDTNWAAAGHRVAWGQVQISRPESRTCSQLQLEESGSPGRSIPSQHLNLCPDVETIGPNLISITSGTGTKWKFDLVQGNLLSWTRPRCPDQNLITEPITVDFYRALTDNDRGGRFGQEWRNRRMHQTKHYPQSIRWSRDAKGVTVTVHGKVAPPVLAWKVELVTSFRFRGDSLLISVKGRPQGLLLPGTFARIGLTLGIRDAGRARWWGRGPGESYRDKKLSQSFGKWEETIDDLFVDYEFPQDGGNRTDVRWVEFLSGPSKEDDGLAGHDSDSERLLRARFGNLDGASFSAMHYTTSDLEECQHPYELYRRKREDTIVRLDWAHHGLGTGSCGPATLPEYELKSKDFKFEVLLD